MNDRNPIDFLVIGAMKAGTTTLYGDLNRHPNLDLPAVKEPGILLGDDLSIDKVSSRTSRLFGERRPNLLRGEASTAYAKFPSVADIPRRAASHFGHDIKLIYMLREPAQRIRSHYDHEVAAGRADRGILEWLEANPSALDFSRYQMQLDQWLECFDSSSILLVNFETYTQKRASQYEAVVDFLGLDVAAVDPPVGVDDPVLNRTAGKSTPRSALVSRALESQAYADLVKPRLPKAMRARARSLLTKTNEAPNTTLSEAEHDAIRAKVGDESWALWQSCRSAAVRARVR